MLVKYILGLAQQVVVVVKEVVIVMLKHPQVDVVVANEFNCTI
tara:strand:+ start:97 stop:225 length:129 start_codon:yes stop_codon:yes gene_type:complete